MLRLGYYALTLCVASVGGAIAWWLNMPLALMVGPMIAVLLAARKLPKLSLPTSLRGATLLGLGVYVGSRFTPELVQTIPDWSLSLGLNALMTLLTWAIVTWLLVKWLKMSAETAAFCAVPGGILAVIESSSKSTADTPTVLFVQAMRMILGMLILPFGINAMGYPISPTGMASSIGESAVSLSQTGIILGASVMAFILGRRLKMAAAEITGPMIATAILYATGTVDMVIPTWIVGVCFVVLGATLGLSLPTFKWSELFVLTQTSVFVFAVMAAITVIFAAIAHYGLGLNYIASLLAFAPSGMTEATSIAVALNLDPAYVAANNMARLTLCSLATPYILVLLKKYHRYRTTA